jgi:thioredoxin-related protein
MSRSRLDIAANVAIIVVCAIASFVLIRNQFFPPAPPAPPGAVKEGERLDALRSVVPAGAERTVVLAVSPQCHFCNESMPFYKRLLDKRNRAGSSTRFVAAVPTTQARDEEAKTFAASGIKPDALVQVDFHALKVPGTPTLMLVDRDGKVLGVWVGKLDERRERDILARL